MLKNKIKKYLWCFEKLYYPTFIRKPSRYAAQRKLYVMRRLAVNLFENILDKIL
jgi:hypothetical protein